MRLSSNKELGCCKRLFTNCFFDNYSKSQQGTISFPELHGKCGGSLVRGLLLASQKNSKNIHSDRADSCTMYTLVLGHRTMLLM